MKEYENDTRRFVDRTSNEFQPKFQGLDEDFTVMKDKMPQINLNTNYLTDGTTDHQELIDEFATARISSDTNDHKIPVQQSDSDYYDSDEFNELSENDKAFILERKFVRDQLDLKRKMDREKQNKQFRPRRIDEFMQPMSQTQPIIYQPVLAPPQNSNQDPRFQTRFQSNNVQERYQQEINERNQEMMQKHK